MPMDACAELVGRSLECARLERLLSAAKGGTERCPGASGRRGYRQIRAAATTPPSAREDFHVVRAVGVESEMELPFAGLHQLCADAGRPAGTVAAAPARRTRDRVRVEFGQPARSLPDQLGGARPDVRGRRGAAAALPDRRRPVARSLERARARVRGAPSGGGAGRLRVRGAGAAESDELARLPDLRLHGLSDAHARELLASVVGAPLDEGVRRRILAEARGNPLALLELPRTASPARAGQRLRPGRRAVAPEPDRGELPAASSASYRPRRRRSCCWAPPSRPASRRCSGDRPRSSGSTLDAMAPAEGDGLLEIGTRVAFRHPLLRSAIYRAATAEDRRAAHRALAAATDAEVDPDRRAWHLARAAYGRDEAVADELERSAGRAQARGGVAAAAAFLQRSAELTVDVEKRARRALEAAGAKQLAGAPEEALALLSIAGEGPLDDLERALSERLRGQINLDLRNADDAVPLLLDAAKRLEPLDPGLARETYLEALRAASVAGRLGGGTLDAARGRSQRPAETRAGTRSRSAARRPRAPLHRRLRRERSGAETTRWSRFPRRAIVLGRTSAGRGSLVGSRRTCSSTTPGTRSPPAVSRTPATPVRSPCSRWPSMLWRCCGASKASLPLRRRWPPRRTRSRRRRELRRSSSGGSCSPVAAGSSPRQRRCSRHTRPRRCSAVRASC